MEVILVGSKDYGDKQDIQDDWQVTNHSVDISCDEQINPAYTYTHRNMHICVCMSFACVREKMR